MGDEERHSDGKEKNFIVRVMSPGELDDCFDLVDKEGWNLTFFKFKKVWEAFPNNIFVNAKKDIQEVVAVVSVIPTSPGQYLVGNLVVKQEYRGLGLGRKMMEGVMELYCGVTLVLTAVPGVDTYYKKLGFQNVESTHHIYFLDVNRASVANACSNYNTDDIALMTYSPNMFQSLKEYDKHSRGYNTEKYLSVMTQVSNHFLLATSKKTGHVVGYVAGIDRGTHLLVDGLYADSDGIALLLFRDLLEAYPDMKEVKVQVLKTRNFLVQFGEIMWPKYHTYIRMAKGPTTPVLQSKLYVVTDCDYSE